MLLKEEKQKILSVDHETMEVELDGHIRTNDYHLYDEACNDYDIKENTSPR